MGFHLHRRGRRFYQVPPGALAPASVRRCPRCNAPSPKRTLNSAVLMTDKRDEAVFGYQVLVVSSRQQTSNALIQLRPKHHAPLSAMLRNVEAINFSLSVLVVSP